MGQYKKKHWTDYTNFLGFIATLILSLIALCYAKEANNFSREANQMALNQDDVKLSLFQYVVKGPPDPTTLSIVDNELYVQILDGEFDDLKIDWDFMLARNSICNDYQWFNPLVVNIGIDPDTSTIPVWQECYNFLLIRNDGDVTASNLIFNYKKYIMGSGIRTQLLQESSESNIDSYGNYHLLPDGMICIPMYTSYYCVNPGLERNDRYMGDVILPIEVSYISVLTGVNQAVQVDLSEVALITGGFKESEKF